MNAFVPAVRTGVSCIIGVAGASGSGKTLSALKLARGLADGADSKIAVIDTEGGRAKHYAPSPGEAPGPETFAFAHADMHAPFSPERYQALIDQADAAGFAVIVIDSFSHEWEGEGGLHDQHESELDKLAGDDAWKREKLSITAWKKPKMAHKRLVSRMLQSRAHLIVCMRAEDKMRMEQIEDDRGKKRTVITAAKDLPLTERWQPICEKRFPYELITSFVLTPDAPGVPVPLKLQAQHRPFVPLDRPLDERVGEGLAAWARGAKRAGPTPARSQSQEAEAPVAAAPGFAEGGSLPGAAFPGDFVRLGGRDIDPQMPCALPTLGDAMASDDWRGWAKALRTLIERAETPGLKLTWVDLNCEPLQRLMQASIKLYRWVREAAPDDDGAALDQGRDGGAAPEPIKAAS